MRNSGKEFLLSETVEPLQQEPKAPFLNATSRGLQKAFNPRRETGAFCSGVKLLQPINVKVAVINTTDFSKPDLVLTSPLPARPPDIYGVVQ